MKVGHPSKFLTFDGTTQAVAFNDFNLLVACAPGS